MRITFKNAETVSHGCKGENCQRQWKSAQTRNYRNQI